MAWVAFLGLLAAILIVVGAAPTSLFGEALSAASIVLLFGHAVLALGWSDALAFAGITLVLTFGVENIGAATGFPFGSYHFVVEADLPHIGLIPPIVGPLYFAMGYAAYVIASLLANRRAAASLPALAATSLMAAFAMTAWDLVIDPPSSTLLGLWVWHQGGAFFGVPLSNFLAWFFETLLVFAAVSAWLKWRGRLLDVGRYSRSFWLVPLLLYWAAGLCQIAPWLVAKDAQVLDHGGRVWSVLALRETAVLMALFAMTPPCLLATFRLYAPSGSRDATSSK